MTEESTAILAEFEDELRAESDRAAVILASAKLDELLYLALTKKLLACPNAEDDLLRTDGPIGSFASRIILAHRLGIIDDDFAKTLHLLRRIRNDFAHETLGAKLTSGSHADRVKALCLPFKKLLEVEAKKLRYLQELEERGLRGRFEFACYYCIVQLEETIDQTVSLARPKPGFLDWAKTA